MRFSRESVVSRFSPRAALAVLALSATAFIVAPQVISAQETTLQPLTYTVEQVGRGKAAFGNNSCTACHGGQLEGLDGGPTLLGDAFKESRFGGSVYDLYSFLLEFMPASDPGTLKPGDALAIVAFLADKNGFKAGDVALPSDPEALKTIGFKQ